MSVPEFAVNPLSQRMLRMLDGLNFKDFVALLSVFSAKASFPHKVEFIFKIYDADGDGKVTWNDVLEVLQDLSGPFLSVEQRQEVVNQAFKESGYSIDYMLTLQDFLQLWDKTGLTMEVEVPVD
ncbi:hypothetical protein KP509_27G029500 [Ceratopteris richardii]|nr:hypothetical protein KP509_27G029500 [Ceratopteris richardii]